MLGLPAELGVLFTAGTIGGIAFGVLLGFMHRLRRILMPYMQAIYGIPRPAMAPIFVHENDIAIQGVVVGVIRKY